MYIGFLITGIVLVILSAILLWKKVTVPNQILTIFVLGLLSIGFYLFKPTSVKWGDVELKLEAIEKNMTEYILVELPSVSDFELTKVNLLKNTVKNGSVVVSPFKKRDRGFLLSLNFEPLFLRVSGEKPSEWGVFKNQGNCCSYKIMWTGGQTPADNRYYDDKVFIEIIR